MNSLLAFIPARGGSKRIPRKNVRDLGGKPLLAYTIEAARASGAFTDIVLSSEDEAVLSAGQQLEITCDKRPENLAGDKIRFVEVLSEYLDRESVRERFQAVMVLLPTCPFRTGADIRQAIQLWEEAPDAAVVSVTEYDFPPEFACDLLCDGSLRLRHPETYQRSTQSQSVSKSYHPNGAIYLSSVGRFRKCASFFEPPVIGYAMPPERSLDLDHPHQWTLAEALLNNGVTA